MRIDAKIELENEVHSLHVCLIGFFYFISKDSSKELHNLCLILFLMLIFGTFLWRHTNTHSKKRHKRKAIRKKEKGVIRPIESPMTDKQINFDRQTKNNNNFQSFLQKVNRLFARSLFLFFIRLQQPFFLKSLNFAHKQMSCFP